MLKNYSLCFTLDFIIGNLTHIIKISNKIIAIILLAANPDGIFPFIIPVTCNIIPINPTREPPATRPDDRLIPFATFTSFSVSFLAPLSIATLINAPTKIIEVVEIDLFLYYFINYYLLMLKIH